MTLRRTANTPLQSANSFDIKKKDLKENLSTFSVSQVLFQSFSNLIECFAVNHKPTLSSAQKTEITPSRHATENSYNLAISGKDDGNSYLYAGSQQPTSACALIYDPTSQTFILDKISAEFSFNLRSTPTEKNPKALASRYPQLETSLSAPNSDSEDLFKDPLGQTGDTENPYDYRHFLNKRRRTSSPSPQPSLPVPEVTVARRPSRTKPKPKPRPSRPQKRHPSPPPTREEADADNEDSDPDVLTIEIEPDTKPRGRFNAAFTHDKRNGPVSLRSAASSVSPAGVRLPNHPGSPSASEEESEDEEMEELLLPSPSAAQEGDVVSPGGEAEDDEEGDLEMALEEALESQFDEEGGGVEVGLGVVGAETERRVVESSSESEEE